VTEGSTGPVRDRSERIPLSLAEQLVGAWRLEPGAPEGTGAEGLVLCTPDGYLSIHVAGEGAALACSGPFTLDEGSATLSVRAAVAPVPGGDADELVWAVELDGDTLTLSPHDGGARLGLRRAGPASA
jgi:hypothetical protein